MLDFNKALDLFISHYADRLGEINHTVETKGNIQAYHYLDNTLLKPSNGPRLLYHGKPTAQIIILTHGLTDSPYYVFAVAKRFYNEGYNVILPLLAAHGLRDPHEALRDPLLDSKWRTNIDNAVDVAKLIGGKISIGGFSTGGSLSLNKILRSPKSIDGGLFLISAALSIGTTYETAGSFTFIQSLTKYIDEKVLGFGQNPYRYPQLPSFAGIELIQIINEK